MAGHAFDPLAPRVPIYEFVASFVGAAGIGVAASVYSDKTEPVVVTVVLFVASVLLFIAAVGWLYLAHRQLVRNAAGQSGHFHPILAAALASVVAVVGVLVVGGVLIVALLLALREDPDFASPYDGLDPNSDNCAVQSNVRDCASLIAAPMSDMVSAGVRKWEPEDSLDVFEA